MRPPQPHVSLSRYTNFCYMSITIDPLQIKPCFLCQNNRFIVSVAGNIHPLHFVAPDSLLLVNTKLPTAIKKSVEGSGIMASANAPPAEMT